MEAEIYRRVARNILANNRGKGKEAEEVSDSVGTPEVATIEEREEDKEEHSRRGSDRFFKTLR